MTKRTFTMEQLDKKLEAEALAVEMATLRTSLELINYHHKKITDELEMKIGRLHSRLKMLSRSS